MIIIILHACGGGGIMFRQTLHMYDDRRSSARKHKMNGQYLYMIIILLCIHGCVCRGEIMLRQTLHMYDVYTMSYPSKKSRSEFPQLQGSPLSWGYAMLNMYIVHGYSLLYMVIPGYITTEPNLAPRQSLGMECTC